MDYIIFRGANKPVIDCRSQYLWDHAVAKYQGVIGQSDAATWLNQHEATEAGFPGGGGYWTRLPQFAGRFREHVGFADQPDTVVLTACGSLVFSPLRVCFFKVKVKVLKVTRRVHEHLIRWQCVSFYIACDPSPLSL